MGWIWVIHRRKNPAIGISRPAPQQILVAVRRKVFSGQGRAIGYVLLNRLARSSGRLEYAIDAIPFRIEACHIQDRVRLYETNSPSYFRCFKFDN